METTYSNYDFQDSVNRISEILDSSDSSYEDHKGIPSRDSLTFTNGFYVDVTVLFVDIRGSKELSEKHIRPVLAKLYRAYISEVVAVLKGTQTINEVYIEGDGIWAVFNTTTMNEVTRVLETAGQVASLIDILNIKLEKKGYSKIEVGIGLDDGSALYIKAGYRGSGVNEVVWIGRVVGNSAELSSFGKKTLSDERIMISAQVYNNLNNDGYREIFTLNANRSCYHGNFINIVMNDWVKENG